jgi:hypothetical protein
MDYELHRQLRMALELREPYLADNNLTGAMARGHSSLFVASHAFSDIPSRAKGDGSCLSRPTWLACACLSILSNRARRIQPRRWKIIREPRLVEKHAGTEPYQVSCD